MSAPLRIGIAGLGTVGAGTVKLLHENAAQIAARCGRPLQLVAVSARDASRVRDCDVRGLRWENDPLALANAPDIDLVAELIGGSEGVAHALVLQALTNGKLVVTANKALMARHGVALSKLAQTHNAVLAFEAAVAGGVPVIDVLRHGLSANRYHRLAGILNGTCNYILSTMLSQGREFDDVLKEAQALGYAEADPTFDVGGIDAAHKLAILTSLAFGTQVNMDAVHTEGITQVTRRDMHYAGELGYVIKLLGIAEQLPTGILQRVHPCLVPSSAPMAVIGGAFNAVQLDCSAAGRILLEGAGAGAGPTASAVVSDMVQLARGVRYHPFTLPTELLAPLQPAQMGELLRCHYLRVQCEDKPGVLADITSIFAREHISVQSLIQHTHEADAPAEIVITTHETREASMQQALKQIAALPAVLTPPYRIRIESL